MRRGWSGFRRECGWKREFVKVLKAIAAYHDISLGNLLEGIVLHAFDGKCAFTKKFPAADRRVQETLRLGAGRHGQSTDGGQVVNSAESQLLRAFRSCNLPSLSHEEHVRLAAARSSLPNHNGSSCALLNSGGPRGAQGARTILDLQPNCTTRPALGLIVPRRQTS